MRKYSLTCGFTLYRIPISNDIMLIVGIEVCIQPPYENEEHGDSEIQKSQKIELVSSTKIVNTHLKPVSAHL